MKPLTRLAPRVTAVKLGIGQPWVRRGDDQAQARKRFYDTARWQRARAAKLRRDPLCQACAHEQRAIAAEHVDHWVPLAQGGHPTADENLVSLCHSCHSVKTRCEQLSLPFPLIVASQPRTLGVA